jgi:hypothetical protein
LALIPLLPATTETSNPKLGKSVSWAIKQMERGREVTRLQWVDPPKRPPYLYRSLTLSALCRIPAHVSLPANPEAQLRTNKSYLYELSLQDKEAKDWVRLDFWLRDNGIRRH